MKITKTSEPTRVDRVQPSKGGASRASAASKANPSGSSSVHSTDATSRLSQLESQFSQSGFDAAKVSEVKSAITEGRYQVNSGVVADKLIASAAQLAGRKITG
jgi:negative regulator of flagellin synthesis FlgM